MTQRLVDWQIRSQCEQFNLVDPFHEFLVNPTSLDIRLGDHLLIESCERRFVRYDLYGHSKANPYDMVPGQFVLAPSLETFNVPINIVGEVRLKSTVARQGLDLSNAGYLDPGWHGSKLTMQLKNTTQLQTVPLWPGMQIAQVLWDRLAVTPHDDYSKTGRYNGDTEAQEAKP